MPGPAAKAAMAIALSAGTAHLAWQAYRLNFDPRLVADPRNPYVYAHTPMGLPRLTEQLERLRQQMPDRRALNPSRGNQGKLSGRCRGTCESSRPARPVIGSTTRTGGQPFSKFRCRTFSSSRWNSIHPTSLPECATITDKWSDCCGRAARCMSTCAIDVWPILLHSNEIAGTALSPR